MNSNESVGEKAEPPAEPRNFMFVPVFGTAGNVNSIINSAKPETTPNHGISAFQHTSGFSIMSAPNGCGNIGCAYPATTFKSHNF